MNQTFAPDERSQKTGPGQIESASFPPAAIALLILSALIALVRSHFQFLSADELGFGLLYLLRTCSFFQFVHLQLTIPVSFDPIGYNALLFAIVRLLGTSVFVMRLPAICGYLGMQLCLFYLVRRIAGARAATVSLAIPAILELATYGIQARPYGPMLGLAALAALSWQTASRNKPRRTMALIVLALSLALAVNFQYFAVLLFVPIWGAELARILLRKRIDFAMLASITAGLLGLLLVIPFAHALLPFRANHIGLVEFDYRFILHSYLWLAALYVSIDRTVRALSVAFLLLLLGLTIFFIRRRSAIDLDLPLEELLLIVLFCAFPALAFVVAKFGTHWVDSRYTQPAIIGIAPFLAILMAPVLKSGVATKIVLTLLFLSISISGIWHIISAEQQTRTNLDAFAGSPEARAYLDSHPNQPIMIADHTVYEQMRYYAPHSIASRIDFVVSPEQYVRLGVGSDVSAQMRNMLADHVVNVVPYSAVSQRDTDQIFLLYHHSFGWTDRMLAESHAQINYIGHISRGDLVSVYFP